MTKILVKEKEFFLTMFKTESELEKVVVQNHTKIFGENTYYFDLKKGIKHKKGDLLTIPDGYLLRFSSNPSLTIIENELSTHDTRKHIGLQFVNFNSALTDISKYKVKKFLNEYLKKNSKEHAKVKQLLSLTPFNNSSDLLDAVVMEQKMDFGIIIDETSDELERIISPFNPEIIVLKKFQSKDGEVIYHLESDSEIVEIPILKKSDKVPQMRNSLKSDTLVCGAQEEGFNDVFLKENRWFAIRIHPKRISQIKYLAMYEVKPISAIRYIGDVKEIKPYKNSRKFEVVLKGPATKLKTPIILSSKYPNLAPQAPKYTSFTLFKRAKKLEDIFPRT